MRVEVTFAGDPTEAIASSEAVIESLKKLFRAGEETGLGLSQVKISVAQASESDANARRIKDQLDSIRFKADETTRSLRNVKVSGGAQGLAANLQAAQTVGLAGLVGLGVAGSGPVGAAAAAAGIAGLVSVVGELAPAVGVLALAFHGMGGAIEGNLKDFQKLDPAAQQFVQTIRSLDPWLKSLQQTAQAGILPGADQLLHSILSPQNAAAIKAAVGGISQAIGDGEKEWAKAFTSPVFTSDFSTVIQHATVWLREDADAALQLAEGVGKIVVAGLPLTDWFQKSIDDGAKLFNTWVDGEQASGKLSAAMGDLRTEAQLVGHFVVALVSAVFDLSRDLKPLGDTIIVDLTHGLQDLATWLNQNKKEINDVAQNALQALIGALKIAGETLVPLGKVLYDVTQDTIGFKKAFELLILTFVGFKVAGVVSAIAEIGGASVVAEGEVGGLRAALLGLGAPEVLAAVAAAYGAYKVFEGDKTAGDVVQAGNPYVQGTSNYSAYAAGVAGTKAKGGRVDIGGMTISTSDPAFQAGVAAAKAGNGATASTATQNSSAGSMQSGRAKMLALAQSAIGTPYLWGGDAPGGFDCSGLVEWAFANGLNITLPRTTYGQVTAGRAVGTNTLKGAQPGDVVFTQYGEDGNAGPGHEGIYVGNGQVLAAPRPGGVVSVTSLGAFTSGGKYTVRDIADGAGPAGTSGVGSSSSPFTTPPAFTTGLGSTKALKGFGLPLALQTAIDKSSTTKPSKDDVQAYTAAVAWVKQQITSGITGQNLDDAYSLLASLQGGLASAVGTPGQPKRLSIPSSLSGHVAPTTAIARLALQQQLARGLGGTTKAFASQLAVSQTRNQATDLLGLLNVNPAAAGPAAPLSLAEALAPFNELKAKLGPEIASIQKQLTGLVTPKERAALEAQLAQYKTTIVAGLDSAKQAVANEKSAFQQAFQSVGQAAIDALEKQASSYQSPADILLAQLQAAHNDQQLQSALDQANKDLANAMVPVPDQSTIVQNIQSILGMYNQANLIDQVQSALLGGKSAGVNGNDLLAQLNQAITAASAPDPTAVANAQQEVADATYNIQVDSLQKTAAAQDQAYQDQITATENTITALEAQWQPYFDSLGGNISAISAAWAAMLSGIGVDPGIVSSVVAQAPQTIATATGETLTEILNRTITGGAYGPSGPVQLHAKGGIAIRPIYRNVIGEAGPEAIIPLGDARAKAMLGGGGDTHIIELHGDFGESVHAVLRTGGAIKLINRGLGKSTAGRLKSGAY